MDRRLLLVAPLLVAQKPTMTESFIRALTNDFGTVGRAAHTSFPNYLAAPPPLSCDLFDCCVFVCHSSQAQVSHGVMQGDGGGEGGLALLGAWAATDTGSGSGSTDALSILMRGHGPPQTRVAQIQRTSSPY